MFDASVIPLEASVRASVRAELRKLHDVFDARLPGGIDEDALALFDFSGRRHQQKELLDTVEGASNSFWPSEVTLDQFNSRKCNGPGARAIANKSANGQAPVKKLLDEFEADIAGSASDENHGPS
jgi:hypothetical protein